jgi:hypothetical protein
MFASLRKEEALHESRGAVDRENASAARQRVRAARKSSQVAGSLARLPADRRQLGIAICLRIDGIAEYLIQVACGGSRNESVVVCTLAHIGGQCVVCLLTMHFGPNRCAADAGNSVPAELSAEAVAPAIERLHQAIRARHREVRLIFLETQAIAASRASTTK